MLDSTYTRRQALKTLLAMGAATTAMGIKTAVADEWGRSIVVPDVTVPPLKKPKIFNAMEVMVGAPDTYIPKARVLKEVFATSWSKLKVVAARHLVDGHYDRYADWKRMLERASHYPAREQMEIVNAFVNNAAYVSDRRNFGEKDNWVLPEVFLRKGGDCEDFAITKLASLRALGFHPDRLRIVIADNMKNQNRHAVLAVYYDDDVHIFDNMYGKVMSQKQITHYQPVCSLNNNCLWLHLTDTSKAQGAQKVLRSIS